MKNKDMYKSGTEMSSAFYIFCESHKDCVGCPLDGKNVSDCKFEWMFLDYEKLHIDACPFCGGKCVAHDGSKLKQDNHGIKPYSYVECTKCGYRSRTTDDYEHEGIGNVIYEHNRIVRKLK